MTELATDGITTNIAVYGASGLGKEIAGFIENLSFFKYKVLCYIDDDEKKTGIILNDLPIKTLDQLVSESKDVKPKIVIGVGIPKIRELLTLKIKNLGFELVETLIHPSVRISKWVNIDNSCIIFPGASLTTNIKLGKYVLLNPNCTIGHDVVIGDYNTICPGVNISGCVVCGNRVFIGAGAVIINGTQEKSIMIGDDVIIGAGACVIGDIPKNQIWGGIPAKPLHPYRST